MCTTGNISKVEFTSLPVSIHSCNLQLSLNSYLLHSSWTRTAIKNEKLQCNVQSCCTYETVEWIYRCWRPREDSFNSSIFSFTDISAPCAQFTRFDDDRLSLRRNACVITEQRVFTLAVWNNLQFINIFHVHLSIFLTFLLNESAALFSRGKSDFQYSSHGGDAWIFLIVLPLSTVAINSFV